MTVEYKGKTYDDRHGGPFDRGSADSYYGRPFKPLFSQAHCYQYKTSPVVPLLTLAAATWASAQQPSAQPLSLL